MLQTGKQAWRERVLGVPKLGVHNRQSQVRTLVPGPYHLVWTPSLFFLLGADIGGYFTARFLHLGQDPPSVLGVLGNRRETASGGSSVRGVSGGEELGIQERCAQQEV